MKSMRKMRLAGLVLLASVMVLVGCNTNAGETKEPVVIKVTQGNFEDGLKQAIANPGSTLVLEGNISLQKEITITFGNFTLDLNGKKIDSSDIFHVKREVKLTIKDTLGKGCIFGQRRGIVNYGILTVLGGSIIGESEGISNYGTMELYGGEIIGGTKGVINGGIMMVSGGKITGTDSIGVENSGILKLSGKPAISGGQNSFQLNKPITIVGPLTNDTPYTADLFAIAQVSQDKTTIVGEGYTITEEIKNKFKFKDHSRYSIELDPDRNALILTEPNILNALSTNFDVCLANAMETPGSRLILLEDIAISKTIEITSGNFTLDLNGKTIRLENSEAQRNLYVAKDAILTIEDRLGGGSIIENNYTLSIKKVRVTPIENEGILTVRDINITGTDSGVYNFGTLTLTGCTISAINTGVDNNGTLTVKDSDITGGISGVNNNGTLNLSGNLKITTREGGTDFSLYKLITIVGNLEGDDSYSVKWEGSTKAGDSVIKGGENYSLPSTIKDKFNFYDDITVMLESNQNALIITK